MKIQNNPPYRKMSFRQIFSAVAIVLILYNSVGLAKDINKTRRFKALLQKAYFAGFKFNGLDKFLAEADKIGYYTDRDPDDKKTMAQFSQAQYTLAPIILEFNNTDHQFIVFDCSSENIALEKIRETNAVALKKNAYGIILARKLR